MNDSSTDTPAAVTPASIEHPAYRAARMCKELYEKNLDMIADGYVFMREGVDVNEEMLLACKTHIAECEKIMAMTKDMDPKNWGPSPLKLQTSTPEHLVPTLPEQPSEIPPDIGNFDHEKNS